MYIRTLLAVLMLSSVTFAADPLGEIFYVPFEGSADATVAGGDGKSIHAVVDEYVDGKAGKAAKSSRRYTGIRWDGRGNIDLDRGTMAFFYRPTKDVVESEWETIAGVCTDIDGYWGGVMQFHQIGDTLYLQLFDRGRYTQRVSFGKIVGRWKAGEWHHIAAVWDRNEGIKIYEDGKLVDSNWGRYRWDWNMEPRVLHLGQPIYSTQDFTADELHVFNQCLTDAQIAQLAKAEKPTGDPLAITPAEQRRANDLARMGWTDADLPQIVKIEAGKPMGYTFARIDHATDAKRLVAQAFEGLPSSAWPLTKYGASVSGKTLELYFAPNQTYDRVRLIAQRPFAGRLSRMDPVAGLAPLLEVSAERPIWRGTFNDSRIEPAMFLQRDRGHVGQIDFYAAAPADLSKIGQTAVYTVGALPEKPQPTEAVEAILGDTPARFVNIVTATQQESGTAQMVTPAFGGMQIVSEPITKSTALDGVVVKLVTGKIENPTPVTVTVKEPVWLQRDWLTADAVLQPSSAERNEYTLVLKGRPVLTPVPGTKVARGNSSIEQPVIQLAVEVVAGESIAWSLGKDGTSVALILGDEKAIKPIAVADQIEFAREAFAESMEGHIWDGHPLEMYGRLAYPLLYLMGIAPDERAVMQLATRLNWRTDDLPFTPPTNTLKAPEWAFWQLEALKENQRLLNWMIEHRQLPNGEFGGVYGDDTDLVENWVDFALMGDDAGTITAALRRIYDGVWTYNLVDGVSASIRDALHAYEEGMGTIANQLVIDYGNPTAVERTMTASSHYDKWMKKNPDGSYSFRGWYWGASGVWEEGDYGRDIGTNGLAFVPAAYLIWYNRHPNPQPYIVNWKLKLDGGGVVPDTVYELLPESEKQAFRDGWYTEQVEKMLGGNYIMSTVAILDEIGIKDAWKEKLLNMGQRNAKIPNTSSYANLMCDGYWAAYLASGDIKYLTQSYVDTCKLINNLDWTYTVAQPSTDRIPPPHSSLSRARLGAQAVNRAGNGSFWPRHAISMAGPSEQVGVLVTDNQHTGFTSRFWSFHEAEYTLPIRVWRIHPGRYSVELFTDANDDGKPEESIEKRELDLVRGSTIGLKLPPRQGVVLVVKSIRSAPMNYDLPDPAIGAEDVTMEFASGHLHVTVHNIGIQPTEKIQVRVTDARSGQVVAEQTLDKLDAPLDLKPRKQRVEFHNVDCVTHGGLIVELNPDGTSPDLNPFNNKVAYKY